MRFWDIFVGFRRICERAHVKACGYISRKKHLRNLRLPGLYLVPKMALPWFCPRYSEWRPTDRQTDRPIFAFLELPPMELKIQKQFSISYSENWAFLIKNTQNINILVKIMELMSIIYFFGHFRSLLFDFCDTLYHKNQYFNI